MHHLEKILIKQCTEFNRLQCMPYSFLANNECVDNCFNGTLRANGILNAFEKSMICENSAML